MAQTDFRHILRALYAREVEFIVVGGLAAVLNGAPVNTFDLDIVHARTKENVARLLDVLESLDAIYRMQRERRLRPGVSHLNSPEHHNLITNYGPLDVLGTIGSDLTYEDLFSSTTDVPIDSGVTVRVLNLDTLISLKEQLNGEKDKAVLPILRRTREERQRRTNSD